MFEFYIPFASFFDLIDRALQSWHKQEIMALKVSGERKEKSLQGLRPKGMVAVVFFYYILMRGTSKDSNIYFDRFFDLVGKILWH